MNSDSVAQATRVTNQATGKSVNVGLSWNKDFTELTLQPNGTLSNRQRLSFADHRRGAGPRWWNVKGWILGELQHRASAEYR